VVAEIDVDADVDAADVDLVAAAVVAAPARREGFSSIGRQLMTRRM
jgi:hypothetical protein